MEAVGLQDVLLLDVRDADEFEASHIQVEFSLSRSLESQLPHKIVNLVF